jgi:hypothetical protein
MCERQKTEITTQSKMIEAQLTEIEQAREVLK